MNVTGSDAMQTSANCQPLTRANIIEPMKATIKWANMTTFSPRPSSNFVRSLELNLCRKFELRMAEILLNRNLPC